MNDGELFSLFCDVVIDGQELDRADAAELAAAIDRGLVGTQEATEVLLLIGEDGEPVSLDQARQLLVEVREGLAA